MLPNSLFFSVLSVVFAVKSIFLRVTDGNLIENANAVWMSHYPPDPHFLDLADSPGLYILENRECVLRK